MRRGGGDQMQGDHEVEEPVAEPEGGPDSVDRRGQRVACLIGEQRGGPLRDASRRDREREDQQRRFRRPVPADEVRGYHESPRREPVQPKDRRRGDRLQEDPRMFAPFAELTAGAVGDPACGWLRGCTHDKPPEKYFDPEWIYTRLTPAGVSNFSIRLSGDTGSR